MGRTMAFCKVTAHAPTSQFQVPIKFWKFWKFGTHTEVHFPK